MGDHRDDLAERYVDWEGQSAWIAEHMDLPRATVDLVLLVEWELMIGVGIVTVLDGSEWDFQIYDPVLLAAEPNVVVTSRIAEDAAERFGLSFEEAHRVLEGELAFLQMRGFA